MGGGGEGGCLIPLFQSGCLGGSRGSGIGIASHLRRSARQRYSLRHYRAIERRYTQAVAPFFGKRFIGCDPGDVMLYVLMKIICPLGFKVT